MDQRIKKALSLAIICCLSFIAFSYLLRRNLARAEAPSAVGNQLTISANVNNAPLPQCELVNKRRERLSDKELRTGKVMLVLVSATCEFCLEDGNFLRERIAARKDIRFYGVMAFGSESDVVRAEPRFPFALYSDGGGKLREGLGVNGVPVKLYLEDGVVKKVWMGSTVTVHEEKAFDEWLRTL